MDSSTHPIDSRPTHGFTWRLWIATMLVMSAGPFARAEAPAAPGLPELVKTKHRSFAIPFRIPKSDDPDADAAPQKVLLNVSADLGASWQPAGEASPSATSFTYRAETDGEYWFRLRAVDRKGRSRGGEGPDIRVLVDAAGPRLSGRVWKGADGEIICRYAAADDTLRMESLKVEYRGAGDNGWKSVAAQAILARESPAHLVGEEIWWAGEKVETLTVRIAIADSSGNQTVKQFTLEQADPRVDQTALAKEIGVPPLPAFGGSADATVPSTTIDARPVSASPATAGAWSAEQAAPWADGQPRGKSPAAPSTDHAAAPAGSRSILVRPAAASAALLPHADGRPGSRSSSGMSQAAGGGLEYRGRPLQLTRSRRFVWDYEIPAARSNAGALRAELWTTADGGVTWQRTAVDTDGRSPIDVSLPAAGLYGVRLELVADADDDTGGPRSGAAPDAWVGVDEEAPQVDLAGVGRDDATPSGALLIRYASRDPLMTPKSVRLLYSPNADGPWATIADGADNQGEHRWTPDRNVPAKVFIRVEASDAAGNVGSATTPDAISVTAPRFGGKLGGLRPLPATP